MVVAFEMEEGDDPLASPVEDGSESNSGEQRRTPNIGLSRTQSSLYRSTEENAMTLLLKCSSFLQGITLNGLETTVNIYLVVIIGFTPLKASWIWFTKYMICLFGTTPVGAFVDRTKKKKTLLFVAAVSMIASGIIILTTTNFVALIFKGLFDGIGKTLLIPSVTAMTLGTVGKTRFHRKHAAVNLMTLGAAKGLGSILVGGIAYAIYPDVWKTFFIFIGVGIASIICVLLMPNESEAVDSNIARGKSMRVLHKELSKLINVEDYSSDDEFDDDDDGGHKDPQVTATSTLPSIHFKGAEEAASRDIARSIRRQGGGDGGGRGGDGNREEGMCVTNNAGVEVKIQITSTMTISEMMADPSRRRSLISLFLVYFSFHLVNATTLPLLGQYLGIHDNKRDALLILSMLRLCQAFGAFFTDWYLKGNLRYIGYRSVLLFGCCVLSLRLILISILVNYQQDNLWAIGCTNIIDGFGSGSLDLMVVLYSHLLSRQTGNYNLNFGVIATGAELGGAVSILLGGALATKYSYEVTFPILAAMTLFPILFSFGVSTPSLYDQVKRGDDNHAEH